MNTIHYLSVEKAGRLAVTATVADLEDRARIVAVHGRVDLDELVGVLDVLSAASRPRQQATPALLTLSAS